MDDIIAEFDKDTLYWFMFALDEAAMREDQEYVQPEFQDRQFAISGAMWKLARLVEARAVASVDSKVPSVDSKAH